MSKFKVGDTVKVINTAKSVPAKRDALGKTSKIKRQSSWTNNAWVLEDLSRDEWIFYDFELELVEETLPRQIKFSEIKKGDRIHVDNNAKQDKEEVTFTVHSVQQSGYGEFGHVHSYPLMNSHFISEGATITLLSREPEPLVKPAVGSQWKDSKGAKFIFAKSGYYLPFDWIDSAQPFSLFFSEEFRNKIEGLERI